MKGQFYDFQEVGERIWLQIFELIYTEKIGIILLGFYEEKLVLNIGKLEEK